MICYSMKKYKISPLFLTCYCFSILCAKLCISAEIRVEYSTGMESDEEDQDEFHNENGFVIPSQIFDHQRTKRSISTPSVNSILSNFNFNDVIPSNYNIHLPPPTENGTSTQVEISVLILNVRDIKELSEELSLELNFRIFWKDIRLENLANLSKNINSSYIVLNPMILTKLWHPDIFIDHVKAVTQPSLMSRPPSSLRIYSDSTVRYSARITLQQACGMDFHFYPADTQRCNVDMKSYSYTDSTLNLTWKGRKGATLANKLYLPNFDVGLDNPENYYVETTSGRYSAIRFTILLRRKLSYHLLQTYLPSTLFIMVSWLSFLVPPESVPGRMALCMMTLLTLTSQFSSVRQNTPNVSYVKALDIWMVVCIIFVFLTLLEYTILLKLKSKKEKVRPISKHSNRQEEENNGSNCLSFIRPKSGYGNPVRSNGVINRGLSRVYNSPLTNDFSTVNIPQNISLNVMKDEHMNNTNRSMGAEPDSTISAAIITLATSRHGSPVPSQHSLSLHHIPSPRKVPMEETGPPSDDLNPNLPNKYELAAKKIEKFTSAAIPTLFIIFNFLYWPWLIESANYYHHFDTTVYYSI